MEQSVSDKKKSANAYRKDEDFAKAIPLYETLWQETGDAFDGAGLLSCYRKTGLFDKALLLAEELSNKHGEFNWAAREICWTLIQGRIQKFNKETPLEEVIQTANNTLEYKPDLLANKLVVFKVLKLAKNKNDWNTIANWVDRLEVENLSIEPMHFDSGRDGWSDQCLWYNYKINSLLKTENYKEAKEKTLIAEGKCPKQRLFFLRLQAHALEGLGETQAALGLYDDLCNKRRPEWWLLHEYGNLLKEEGETDKALSVLCKAALSNRKLEMMVKLFSDIAEIFSINQSPEKARAHRYLEKFVRNDSGWPISSSLTTTIERLDSEMMGDPAPLSKQEAFSICQEIWKEVCGHDASETRAKKKDLMGKLTVPKNKSFGFVNTKDGLSAICFSKNIPDNVNDGDTVIFDAIPSFDKKKNKESWKVIKIKRFNVRK